MSDDESHLTIPTPLLPPQLLQRSATPSTTTSLLQHTASQQQPLQPAIYATTSNF